jgi:uncharacterized membrane protein (DUF2068 family)
MLKRLGHFAVALAATPVIFGLFAVMLAYYGVLYVIEGEDA